MSDTRCTHGAGWEGPLGEPMPCPFCAMTDAEALAAAAADECRKVLKEKDVLLEQARDERDALASDLFAARQALITEGVARDAAERALSEARGPRRSEPCACGAWDLGDAEFRVDAARKTHASSVCCPGDRFEDSSIMRHALSPEGYAAARAALAAPVPPGETTPAPGFWRCRICDEPFGPACAGHEQFPAWTRGTPEEPLYTPEPAAPAAHPETTQEDIDHE